MIASYLLATHIISIIASSVLLYYDVLFIRNSFTCLWPNDFCNEDQLDLHLFSIALSTSTDIHPLKFILIKIQIACCIVMVIICVIYICIYLYTIIRVYTSKTVTDPQMTIELGCIQSPPPPYWPTPPPPSRELPQSSEF